MSNFRPITREMDYLMPPSVDEWLPQRHLARFVVVVIEGLTRPSWPSGVAGHRAGSATTCCCA